MAASPMKLLVSSGFCAAGAALWDVSHEGEASGVVAAPAAGRSSLGAVCFPEELGSAFFCFTRPDSRGGLLFLAVSCMAGRKGALVQHRPEQKFQLGGILQVSVRWPGADQVGFA